MLAFGVELHLAEEDGVTDAVICAGIVVQIVGQCRECLAGGEGPDGTVPFTSASSMTAELRMTTLSSGQTIRCNKALFFFKLLPGDVIFAVVGQQIAVPGHISDSLAYLSGRVATERLEELMVRIP